MNIHKNLKTGLLLTASLLVVILSGCDAGNPESDALLQERAEKDTFFASDKNSPIPLPEREAFTGLHYFPPNSDLSFSGPIDILSDEKIDTIATTRENDLRPALRYGYFNFRYQNADHRLLVYKFVKRKPGYGDYLFLGFTDQTTGNETYGAGRYIDLVVSSNNYYTIDFNRAYNPYCAYSDKYSCPIPPAENRLPFRVNAGEKSFH